MAQIPFQNFAFTDPVPAQQAVQMAQIINAAQAEKDRNLANFAQETIRSRTAQQNAAQQRSIQQGQLNQQMMEGQLNRQARATETDKDIASREKIAGVNVDSKKRLGMEADAFDSIASLIDSDDPPTDSEFEALAIDMTPDRKMPLKMALKQQRRALSELATEAQQLADFWNSRFKVIPNTPNHKSAKESFAKDRRAQELIIQDPRTMEFVPKVKGPRLDAGPSILNPQAVTSIEELRARMSVPNVAPGGLNLQVPGAIPMPMPSQIPTPAVPRAGYFGVE